MASPDRELEQQLMEAGNRLLQHPYSVDELLLLLDQIENFLSRVEQSPPKSMQDALAPLLKALVEDELLRHSDFDVTVAVASCISEITRITAPDAPYNDDKMKDVFQLIVSTFENLSDMSSRSYNKRASILETVAKVRSCVVMLDLECDGMIVEMFQHFLKSIRDYHPENVFMSMETIMTLVLVESEDISLELLTPLLASVKRNNEVLPIARKLGEKVFENCAVKLKPDLTQTMKSLGVPLDDYSKVVASICEGTSGAVEHNDGNAFGEQLADERKLTKASSDEAAEADENKSTTASSDATAQVAKECVSAEARPEEVDPVVDRSKAVMSNGITEAGNEGTSVDPKSFKEPEHDYLANKLLNVNLANKGETDDSDAGKLVKSEVKPEQTAKRRGRKPNSSINSMEPFDSSRVVSEKEAEKLPDRRKSRSKDVCTSPREDLSVETTVPSENEKETGIQLSSSEALESDAVNVASPSPSGSLPDESHPKKTGRPKKKESLVQEVAPTVPSENEKATGIRIFSSKASESNAVNVASPSPSGSLPDESRPKKTGRPKKKELVQDVALSVNDVSVKASEATCDSEVKPLRRSGKKATTGITKDDKILSGIETSKNEGGTSDLEPKPLRESSKKGAAGDSEAKPLKQSGKKGVASDSEAKMQKQSIKKGDATSNIEEKSSLKKKENGKRRGRGKDTEEKDLTISSTNDDVEEMVSSPKSSRKLTKDEGCIEETPKIHSKRKRTPGTGKDKVSETAEFGENLVGSKVKVWWPTDRRFYEGVVDSFDPAIKKHKVLYDDGEEETLHLRNERWELIQYDTVSDGEQATEDPRPDTSSEMHKKKKAKTSSGPPSVKQEKMQVSPKRDGAAVVSSSKLKGGGTATKSGCKSKDDVKVDSKSKDTSLKGDTGSKSKDHSKKTGGGKSVDDTPPGSVIKSKDQVDSGTPKTTAKSKQDTPKTVVSKSSKGKSSQSGSKSNASSNGADKVKKSKVNESKGRTPNLNTESDAKSGKKRRRGAKG